MAASANPWSRYRLRLRQDILTKDPRAFLSWDVIADTMAPPPYARFARTERRFLQSHGWARWPANTNAIHQAYHVGRFQNETATAIQDFGLIVEFGGGYGEMRRIAHNLAFSGRYVIFDLPELNALQRYYLSTIGNPRTDTVCQLQSVRAAIECEPPDSRKLFIATWSFDETPLEARSGWTELLSGFDAFLVAYQAEFAGIDNQAFFSSWQKQFPRIRWTTHAIPQVKASFYLFGISSSGCP